MLQVKRMIPWVLMISLFSLGCGQQPPPTMTEDAPAAPSAPEPTTPQERAVAAKAELARRLSGKLMQAMSSGGPTAAIEVCSQHAAKIAQQVGDDLGLKIGRTSHRLRNSENQPPEWAAEWVQQKMDQPKFEQQDSGALVALFPIRLQPQCLTCHGAEDELNPEVRTQLAKFYPDDQATGFAVDDLRGWFWVEVPGA